MTDSSDGEGFIRGLIKLYNMHGPIHIVFYPALSQALKPPGCDGAHTNQALP